jgi:hypothetical protein
MERSRSSSKLWDAHSLLLLLLLSSRGCRKRKAEKEKRKQEGVLTNKHIHVNILCL